MKKTIIFTSLFILIFSGALAAATKTITLACENRDDVPSVMGNSNELAADKPGATIEVLRLIEKNLGIKIKIVRMPWKQALEEDLKNGKVDGVFTASYKKEREAFGVYPMAGGKPDVSKSLYAVNYCFYKPKGSSLEWDGHTLKNLQGKIGAPAGYSVIGDLTKMGYPVEESDGTLTDLKKLAAGNLGAVIALELTADYYLMNNPELAKSIVKIKPPMVNKSYYIMLSHQFVKSDPGLANKIFSAIGSMQGKYKELAKKYLH